MKVSSPDALSAAKGGAVALCADVLRATLLSLHKADAAITYDAIGDRTGAKPQHVGEWCDALSGRTVALYKIAMMGPAVAPAVLRALADAIEAAATSQGKTRPAGELRKVVCDVMARVGELAASVNAGVADGSLDGAEIATIEADVHRIRAALSTIEAGLAQARVALRGGR
ncbi:MAG: hypothetical protein Q8S73_36785 [Deltaproteobacteria bacterium]|nr:hypothetical protein [Myxococcales bacterium]MDP3219716.1 hypothetical protein [Deltaproteobacteria bacterium]